MTRIKNDVAICMLFRDRIEYLVEWLNYHFAIGVDKILLYNNGDILPTYIQKQYDNRLQIINYQNDNEEGRQSRAYNDAIKILKNFRWIGFIDSDEFVVLLNQSTNIKDYLNQYLDYDGVVLYWLLFGSNNHHQRQKSVIESYTQSCPNNKQNNHIKCFVNPKKVNINHNPHWWTTQRGMVNVDKKFVINYYGDTLEDYPNTKPILDRVMRLNHYYTRSWEDFFIDKIKRGGGYNVKRVYKQKQYENIQKENVFNDDIIRLYDKIKEA